MYNIIFPCLIGQSNKIDPFWEKEAEAAKSVGFGISLVSDQNDAGPLLLRGRADNYLYRGWILKPYFYEQLSFALGSSLLTGLDKYLWSYDFPKWYEVLTEAETPKSFIFTAETIQKIGLDGIALEVSDFCIDSQINQLLLKDYLKSRKHEWYDACFIKDAYNPDHSDLIRVMTNFFELQGRDFYGGLVFREFLKLKKLGIHPKSGMPLPIEFRTFFLNQEPLITSMYWNNDIPYPEGVEQPPQAWLEEIGKKMVSPFVALDIAQDEAGKWWVIEVNDGGTAGYPDNIDSKEFYSKLYKVLNK